MSTKKNEKDLRKVSVKKTDADKKIAKVADAAAKKMVESVKNTNEEKDHSKICLKDMVKTLDENHYEMIKKYIHINDDCDITVSSDEWAGLLDYFKDVAIKDIMNPVVETCSEYLSTIDNDSMKNLVKGIINKFGKNIKQEFNFSKLNFDCDALLDDCINYVLSKLNTVPVQEEKSSKETNDEEKIIDSAIKKMSKIVNSIDNTDANNETAKTNDKTENKNTKVRFGEWIDSNFNQPKEIKSLIDDKYLLMNIINPNIAMVNFVELPFQYTKERMARYMDSKESCLC